ncbi:MAG TPA: NAD(P)-dependent oxidoreductase [Steroidobacteraceae bacterium]|nr:NAD(P)-dependent oxidoreductase [Steroidobacteraceae bacterium]
MATLAFMGLGQMGSAMAARLLEVGHVVHVFNRTPARAQPLVQRGALLFGTPAAACSGVDAVISMLADDPASRAIWCGAAGVLSANLRPGVLAIECSTLSQAWVLELAARARAIGLRYLDAPVTGPPASGAAGTLTLLVGASAVDLDDARHVLGALAERIFHFGEVGTGTAYKLIINLLGAVQIASLAESIAIAERAGLNLQTVAAAIACGQAASPQVVRNSHRMVEGDHGKDIIFTPRLRLKDVTYALQLSRQLGVGSPFGSLAEAAFGQLCDAGLQDANESAIVELARRQPP